MEKFLQLNCWKFQMFYTFIHALIGDDRNLQLDQTQKYRKQIKIENIKLKIRFWKIRKANDSPVKVTVIRIFKIKIWFKFYSEYQIITKCWVIKKIPSLKKRCEIVLSLGKSYVLNKLKCSFGIYFTFKM